jgi:RHS repeat-associated protein
LWIFAYKYTGKGRDSESGNDYFGARYYASNMGRFMSPDPLIGNELRLLNPQRWNMYAYAVNSPLTLTDPNGEDAAAVNRIPFVGHDGIVAVDPNGDVTYADFGPAAGVSPYGTAEVTTLTTAAGQLPQLSFSSSGEPTADSLNALKGALAANKNVDPSSVHVAYFKTSAAETAALHEYIQNWKNLADAGKLKYFFLSGANCAGFCQRGLQAAGINARTDQVPIPNSLGLQLWWLSASFSANGREQVTHTVTGAIDCTQNSKPDGCD